MSNKNNPSPNISIICVCFFTLKSTITDCVISIFTTIGDGKENITYYTFYT